MILVSPFIASPKVEETVRRQTTAALEERVQLKLSVPKHFVVDVQFYNPALTTAVACADPTPFVPCIRLNVLRMAYDFFDDEREKSLGQILCYFDMLRYLFPVVEEDEIPTILDLGKDYLDQREKRAKPEELQRHKKQMAEAGKDYEDYKLMIAHLIPGIHDALQSTLSEVTRCFSEFDLSPLRHELDHVDFFSTPLHRTQIKLAKQHYDLRQRFESGDTRCAAEYLAAKLDYVTTFMKTNSLIEARAMFFTHIQPGAWTTTDYDAVKQQIVHLLREEYIKRYHALTLLDALVAKEWNNGTMNRATSNVLFGHVAVSADAVLSIIYDLDISQQTANPALVQKVLGDYADLQKRFLGHVKESVDIIGTAYRQDPSRLARANAAKTYEEYLELCKLTS